MHRVYTLFLLFFCCSSVGQQIDFRVGPYRDQPEERSQRSYHTNKINTVKKNISDNSGNFYPDYGSSDHGYTLFNNHRQCARWNVADYWLGLIQMHGQYIPIGCPSPDGCVPTTARIGNCAIYLPQAAFIQVMRQPVLYNYENFWHFIKSFANYEQLFLEIFGSDVPRNQFSEHAYQRIVPERNWLMSQRDRRIQEQKIAKHRYEIGSTFDRSLPQLTQELSEWENLSDTLHEYDLQYKDHLPKRIAALQEIEQGKAEYRTRSYVLSDEVVRLLGNAGHDAQWYRNQYGNQLQHLLHQECIYILGHTACLAPASSIYDYKSSLVDMADASRGFNQMGASYTSSVLNDLCWAFLEYGSAIAEGIAQGAIGAVQDMIEHPFQTALCVVAGEYVLAYQLLKVTTQLAGIGVTYLVDKQAGRQAWDEYIQPITDIVEAITNKELSLRDGIKGATAIGVGCLAQHKMLKGLGSVYKTVKVKAVEFAKNNPLVHPEAYMATPEGVVLKLNHKDLNDYSITKNDTNRIKHSTIFSDKEIKITFFEKNIKHIFRDKEGHLLDTLENRKLIIDVASDAKNFLGIDSHGNQWFVKILQDGQQIWASVRENLVRNAGINEIPKSFNGKTGLCRI